MTEKGVFAVTVRVAVFLFNGFKDLVDLSGDIGISVKVTLGSCGCRNILAAAVDEHAAVTGILIYCVVNDAFRNQGQIAADQRIGTVVNKVIAGSLQYEINLIQIMVMVGITLGSRVSPDTVIKMELIFVG